MPEDTPEKAVLPSELVASQGRDYISRGAKSSNAVPSIHKRLYEDKDRYFELKNRTELAQAIREQEELKHCTF